jgi:hypothetical protein
MTEGPVWRTIDVVAYGRKLRGAYAVEGETVRVRTIFGERSALLWGKPPESVARYALIEMAREGKA